MSNERTINRGTDNRDSTADDVHMSFWIVGLIVLKLTNFKVTKKRK